MQSCPEADQLCRAAHRTHSNNPSIKELGKSFTGLPIAGVQAPEDPEQALLATEPLLLLNQALCKRHSLLCEPTEELEYECEVGLRAGAQE